MPTRRDDIWRRDIIDCLALRVRAKRNEGRVRESLMWQRLAATVGSLTQPFFSLKWPRDVCLYVWIGRRSNRILRVSLRPGMWLAEVPHMRHLSGTGFIDIEFTGAVVSVLAIKVPLKWHIGERMPEGAGFHEATELDIYQQRFEYSAQTSSTEFSTVELGSAVYAGCAGSRECVGFHAGGTDVMGRSGQLTTAQMGSRLRCGSDMHFDLFACRNHRSRRCI
ncbi:hypothetical protein QFZ99_002053 [Paraburkholderia atlantica]